MVYLALLQLLRTPRLPAVDWTDAPADLNGLVRFGERRKLVSVRVPSRFKRSLHSKSVYLSLLIFQHNEMTAIASFLLRHFCQNEKWCRMWWPCVSFCHLVSVTDTMYCSVKCCFFAQQIIVTGENFMCSPFQSRDEAAYMHKPWSTDQTRDINTFTAIVDLSRFNNSCLKSPASTLVDLTFQSRALRSFSLTF